MSQFAPPQLKFAADRMLGRLAKWLRVLGQDVVYGRHLSGSSLIRAARQEDRIILTRDRRLRLRQPPNLVFIESDDFRQQLRQVALRFHLLRDDDLFRRCLACNDLLQQRSKESVKQIVPEYVFLTQEHFFWCARCRRVYWPATHHEKMLQELKQLGLE